MSDKRENIIIVNLDSFFMMLILALGLLMYHNTIRDSSDRNKNSAATQTSLNQSNGTFCAGIRLPAFQLTWISDKSNFKLLTLNRNQFSENKKADQKISVLTNIRNRTERIQTSFIRYHLFPIERDELPLLS